MTLLYIGIVLFGGLHLFSALLPGMRARLMARFGEGPYKVAYSVISVLGVVFMAWGYALTKNSGEMFYQPLMGAKHITFTLVLLGFLAMASFHGKGYIRLWLQNPFSVGVILWSVGHLIANGKVPVVLIYCLLILISVIDIVRNMVAGNKPVFQPRIRSDIIAVVLALVVYLFVMFVFHPYVIGVPLVP